MRMCVWQLFVCANDICFVLYVRSEMTVLSNNHFPMSGQKTTSKASLHTHGSHHGNLMGSTGSLPWELSWKSNGSMLTQFQNVTALKSAKLPPGVSQDPCPRPEATYKTNKTKNKILNCRQTNVNEEKRHSNQHKPTMLRSLLQVAKLLRRSFDACGVCLLFFPSWWVLRITISA